MSRPPATQIADFERDGYLALPGVVPPALIRAASEAIVRIIGTSRGVVNRANILALDPAFLELVDLEPVLSAVQLLLGSNIYVNHTHLNFNPTESGSSSAAAYGWHRDGGAINDDLGPNGPMLSIKVAFYLTDLIAQGSGETIVIPGSHRTDAPLPHGAHLPEDARRLLVPSGTAVLYDRRLVHSLRSANVAGPARLAVFVQYAFRWLATVDEMDRPVNADRLNATRRQLLGMTDIDRSVGGAAGRSSRYYPDALAVPLQSSGPARVRAWLVRRVREFSGRTRH
jgi:ectoine hydroxylase-related dioxygenase (phytanoyl-CoA dioxygenase family)